MSFKSEIKKVGLFIKDTAKKIGVVLKKVFSSQKFKDSIAYVNKSILQLDKESEKELIKITTEKIVEAESTALKGLKKTEYVISKVLKEVGNHLLLKLKNISVQDIVYLIGILLPQLYGKK
jgi:chemotaxis regulatin CheY-phosphate phosphatase CheZ